MISLMLAGVPLKDCTLVIIHRFIDEIVTWDSITTKVLYAEKMPLTLSKRTFVCLW